MDGELKSQLDLVLYFGEHHPAASATLLIGLDYSRVGGEEPPEHFFRRMAITSPDCQELMV